MFSSRQQLQKKTGPYGIGRLSYLQSLVTEFQTTDQQDAKEQILANLANFAYDPINYDYLRQLKVIDLFLDNLDDSNPKLKEFAIGGLCNVCMDQENRQLIIKDNGVSSIVDCLTSDHEEIVVSAMTTLFYLVTPTTKHVITDVCVIDAMLRFSTSSNRRISNLASLFLQDCCTDDEVRLAREFQNSAPS
ncbi:hypothetical protein CAPTEDRAFT_227167 [Capitella teleta]|uniref:Armadillo repeat-containing domain-containing protein n=1 Tax=Capitella teleta TaxID=283909 RepID=R7UGJ1_CAPTE|nr:hypothetical protein CAPTEDRAFT_227167 [Capitella teleta]|eukprot:ELU05208.1 hypothetical protein CAPTEDRAFT_227167 [Capitella teleta]